MLSAQFFKHLLLAVLLVTTACAAEQPDLSSSAEATPTPTLAALALEWQTFESSKLGFSVQFPGVPNEESYPLDSVGEGIELTRYLVEGQTESGASYAYGIDHMEFPAVSRLASPEMIQQVLDQTRDSVAAQQEATIVAEEEAPLGDFPGREVIMETDEARIVYRLILAGTDFYQLVVVKDQQLPLTEADRRFLQSFALPERVE